MTPITDSCAAGTYCPIVKRILQTLNKRITNAPRVAFYPPSRPVRGMIEVSSFCRNYDWSWGLIGGDLQQTRSKLEIDVLDVDTFAWDDDGHGCAKSGLAWSICYQHDVSPTGWISRTCRSLVGPPLNRWFIRIMKWMSKTWRPRRFTSWSSLFPSHLPLTWPGSGSLQVTSWAWPRKRDYRS